ncbi:MAG: PASTA domain-containing protein [Candidatus Glassbacteria bacterium]|nr:PASTA domain-containing protein [Candidatus Glassbacteria bacterium]
MNNGFQGFQMGDRLKNILLYLLTAAASFFFGLFVLDQVILPQLAGGKILVEVPALEEIPLSQARKLCQEAGLLLSVRGETYNDEVPAENILKQEPDPGIVVKQGRNVYVLVSLGPEIVRVPRVEGLTLRQAKILIERSRLVLGEVKRQGDPAVGRDRVLEVEPKGGTALPKGTELRLVVSDGVPKVEVPAVIDNTLEQAREIIERAGLRLGAATYKYNRYIPEGRVLDQSPLERAMVDVGTEVNLVLSTNVR